MKEYLSPDEFLLREEAGCITRENWQSLCLYFLERGNSDLLILNIAANGMEDWQARPEDSDHIRQLTGILNSSEDVMLHRIEKVQIEQYSTGKYDLSELIHQETK